MRHSPFAGLSLAAAAMYSLTYPPRSRAPIPPRDISRATYHRPGHDTVLMDWDLPKGKRAKRRARGRDTAGE